MSIDENNSVEIATYESWRTKFRYHWAEGRKQARQANDCINGMVVVLHRDNPSWSVNKIAEKITNDNQDLEGFSRTTIYDNLNDENRMLIDTSKQKKKSTKSNDSAADHSKSEREMIKIIESLRKDLEKRDEMLINLQETINTMKQEQQEKSTSQVTKASELKDNDTLLHKDKEIEGLRKMLFDKNQHIEDLESKLDKAIDKMEEALKQQQTSPTATESQTESVISKEGIYILGEKSIPSIFKMFKSGKNIGIPDQSKINPQRLQQLEQLATKMVN